ncbi:MAG TPA: DUF3471 domain-containing protein, partial [Thermoanaerobaculia bacterium]|nr:DUF3471 domain-containing protein [Thermoanaerobaculia bacterium]
FEELGPTCYGLGLFVTTYRGHLLVHHGGNIDGFSALVTLLPKDDLGMVVLTNKNGTGTPERLVRHTLDRILKLDPIDWNGEALAEREKAKGAAKEAKAKKESVRKKGTKPAHKLADYAGEYEHPAYGIVKVAVAGNRLDLTVNNITTPLEHWHYEVWNGAKGTEPTFEDSKFMFQGDLKGNVAALSAQFEPQVKDIVFTKKPDARLFDPAYLERYTGEYDLSGQTVTISLQGNSLTASLPGQPELHLVPGPGGEFIVKEYTVISVSFEEDAKGNVTSGFFNQPDGVYEMKKKK